MFVLRRRIYGTFEILFGATTSGDCGVLVELVEAD